MEKIVSAHDLYCMESNCELPPTAKFRIVGGRTVYTVVGWMWRNSNKQVFLNKYDCHDSNEEKHRRYLTDDTQIEILLT